ncbi:hypothetical protein ACFCX0_05965 [Streptomyces sp. NPDC056352]|uniref:hypothetical protein n=1 Tax=Streptomyces sp. NPDC056352 TaxID=3345791 RepID=UPI0035DC1D1B
MRRSAARPRTAPPGSGSGHSGTAAGSNTGNTCAARCRAGILYEQQRLLAVRQAHAEQIGMLMYGVMPSATRLLPVVDLRGNSA